MMLFVWTFVGACLFVVLLTTACAKVKLRKEDRTCSRNTRK